MQSRDFEHSAQHFDKCFSIGFASGSEMDEIYSSRYSVYVNEFGFLPENESNVDIDEFDQDALHVVVRHRATGLLAGYFRYVISHGEQALPFAKYLPEAKALGTSKSAEVSRLFVSKAFRKRLNDTIYSPVIFRALYLSASYLHSLIFVGETFILAEQRLARAISNIDLEMVDTNVEVEMGHKKRRLYSFCRTGSKTSIDVEQFHRLFTKTLNVEVTFSQIA